MISICLSVVHGKYIKESINSIFNSKFKDFEVVLNDSTHDFYISDIISDYDVNIIKKQTKSLESRSLTVMASKGDKIILFDETRIMTPLLLEKLNSMQNELVAIGESDIGKGITTLMSNLDKQSIPKSPKLLSPFKNKSVIPRFYTRNIVNRALREIYSHLPKSLIREIVALDLELIYYEAYKISQNLGIIPTPEIYHHGDENFRAVFKKYYRYGKTQKMLRNSYYENFAGLSGRNRFTSSPREFTMSIPLQIVRGIPFLFGYIRGEVDPVVLNGDERERQYDDFKNYQR